MALLPSSSTAQFYVEDSLGSSRVVTNNTGVVCYDADFYPFGGERPYTNSCTQNNYKFEGKERDVETSVGPGNTNGNDDFGARYYSNRFGRWLSADWSNVPVPVPYANLTNPQTLNLYSMVADDPESFADLDGHCCDIWDAIDFVVGFANAYGSDNWAGAGRMDQPTTAGKIGAAFGDATATGQGVTEVTLGAGGEVGGFALDSTGGGAAAGILLNIGSAALIGDGTIVGTEGAAHLGAAAGDAINGAMESRRTGDFTPVEKAQMDQSNANQNGGQNKCTQCGQDVQKVQNQRGQPTPGNQLQRHHDPPLSKGGHSKSPKNRIVCKDCHVKIHKPPQPPPPPRSPQQN